MIITLSDASHVSANNTIGQPGKANRLKHDCDKITTYFAIFWLFHKQMKVSYFSFGAKFLAAVDADDRELHVKPILIALFPNNPLMNYLLVD